MPRWQRLIAAVRAGEPACRVVVLETPSALNPLLGTRWVTDATGAGLAPGPEKGASALEPLLPQVQEWARAALTDGRPRVERLSDSSPGPAGPEPVTLFLDPVLPPPHLMIVGGGHLAAALAPAALAAGFRVTVVDDRPEYARPERFPGATTLCADMLESLRELRPGSATFVVLAGRSHDLDPLLLEAALRQPVAYVGLVGSRRRVAALREGLAGAGTVSPAALSRLHAPVGLDLGGETPAEIAVAIVAELIAVRRGGSCLPLAALPGGSPAKTAGAGIPAGDLESLEVWLALEQALAAGTPAALATVVQVRGTAPRGPGARMLVRADGSTVGTVGGGRNEAEVVRRARQCIEQGYPLLYRSDYQGEPEAMCGGSAEVWIEVVRE